MALAVRRPVSPAPSPSRVRNIFSFKVSAPPWIPNILAAAISSPTKKSPVLHRRPPLRPTVVSRSTPMGDLPKTWEEWTKLYAEVSQRLGFFSLFIWVSEVFHRSRKLTLPPVYLGPYRVRRSGAATHSPRLDHGPLHSRLWPLRLPNPLTAYGIGLQNDSLDILGPRPLRRASLCPPI